MSHDLFLPAALEAARAPLRTPPAALESLPRWVRAGFWVLVASAVGAVAAAGLISVDEHFAAPAAVTSCVLTATVPARYGDVVRAGAAASFRGAERVDVVLEAAEPSGDAIAVRGLLRPCPGADPLSGTLEVVVGSRSLLSFLPGVGSRARGGP